MKQSIFYIATFLLLLNFGKVSGQCIAAFSWDDTNPTIQFFDESTVDPGDVIVSWFWDFDDENFTSNLQNPVHTFTEIDKFDVELTITTANGCTSEIKIRIEICNFNINVNVGECNGSNEIPITINVVDVYDNADEIDIAIDGQILPGGPYPIDGANPANVSVFVFGDGLQHTLTVQSTDIETCNESFSFTADDCTSDCFLGSMQVQISGGITHTVLIGDNFFNPVNTTIVVGDVVTFDWVGSGHSTTSDATTGVDSWDSGVIRLGSTFDVNITNPGVHPFYCIPHGGPGGVGMSGTIIANCPPLGSFDLSINFNTSVANPAGYEVLVDSQVQAGSPHSYNGVGAQNVSATILGDGLNHVIQIRDIADPTCIAERNFLAPDCGAAPSCSITVAAEENGACDANDRVPVQLTINSINGSALGYNVSVDGINVTGGPFAYDASGVTLINVDVIGDGQSHNILVSDAADLNCSGVIALVTSNCMLPCFISNLEISTGTPTTHIVNVEDFAFNPTHTTISSGDIVQWNWTGVVAHTSTSDATSGADSWASDLLNTGGTFQSPILSEGVHPYYCIPHGGPGGVGMSGSITVLRDCTNGQVATTLSFNASGGSFDGYNVLVDGLITANSPQAYDPSGLNSIVINIAGDGQSHTIEIRDTGNTNCSGTTIITTPDCNATNCNLTVSAMQNGICDTAGNVPVDIQVSDVDGSADGFTIDVDGAQMGNFNYDVNGTATVTLLVAGDGSSHTIQVADIADGTCNASTTVTTSDCTEPCLISNLEISTGTPTTHIVNVEDFAFSPTHITITSGDIVQWNWTGVVAHTSTSDATSGADSWASDLLNTGGTFQSPVLSDGVHPYYCIPHGGPGGVGMSGSITVLPDCTNGQVATTINFNASGGSPNGYNVFIDGLITASSPQAYDPSGLNSIVVNIAGDEQSHTVEIRDTGNTNCSGTTVITTPDCDATNCNLIMSAMQNGICDTAGNVPVDIQVSDVDGSADGFIISVDGAQIGNFNYDVNGTTTVTLLVAGDGTSHTIQVADIADGTCNASTTVTTSDCTEPCLISNLEISTGTPTTHIVNVEDFAFNPTHTTITSGDIVQWNWTGVVAHTSTSDATSGADSWGSDLLNTGGTFQSPVLSEGVHPYYCIPHGGPGGVGMSGTITVLPNCTNGEVAATLSFNASGGSPNGYNVFIDGFITAGSPQAYDLSGLNSIGVNITGDGQLHTVQIEDSNDSNCSITESIVTPDCEGCENFQAGFDHTDNGLEVSFVDQTTSGANEWLWGFGNGDISNEQNPIYTYEKDSSYVICLLAQNTDKGCISNKCETIEVSTITSTSDFPEYNIDVFPTLLNAQDENIISMENIPNSDNYQLAIVKIYTSSGQLVSSLNIPFYGTVKVPFNYMQPGMYILNLVIGNKNYTVKLLSI